MKEAATLMLGKNMATARVITKCKTAIEYLLTQLLLPCGTPQLSVSSSNRLNFTHTLFILTLRRKYSLQCTGAIPESISFDPPPPPLKFIFIQKIYSSYAMNFQAKCGIFILKDMKKLHDANSFN